MNRKVVIVVQQESMRERPRVHKLCKVLAGLEIPFEVWKFGDQPTESFEGIQIRNLMSPRARKWHVLIRYLLWMWLVRVNGLRRPDAYFYAMGFDSAFPLALMRRAGRRLIFDNLDNISLSHRWPAWFQPLIRTAERWVAGRANLHVIPARARWSSDDANLRVVTNTPSKEMLAEAAEIARCRGHALESLFTVYVNGWLSPTRGISTLLGAIDLLARKGMPIKVLVAGRPGCEDAEKLLALPCVEKLGMLKNAEALATYSRSHVAFTYYDPSITINRLAESQKWTDCWATGTPFICNSEIETAAHYMRAGACFSTTYADHEALARIFEDLIAEPQRLAAARDNLARMSFTYWDDAMRDVMKEWLLSPTAQGLGRA